MSAVQIEEKEEILHGVRYVFRWASLYESRLSFYAVSAPPLLPPLISHISPSACCPRVRDRGGDLRQGVDRKSLKTSRSDDAASRPDLPGKGHQEMRRLAKMTVYYANLGLDEVERYNAKASEDTSRRHLATISCGGGPSFSAGCGPLLEPCHRNPTRELLAARSSACIWVGEWVCYWVGGACG